MRKFLLASAILIGLSLFGSPALSEQQDNDPFSSLRNEQISEKDTGTQKESTREMDLGECPLPPKDTVIRANPVSFFPSGVYVGSTSDRCLAIVITESEPQERIEAMILIGPWRDRSSKSVTVTFTATKSYTYTTTISFGSVAIPYELTVYNSYELKLAWHGKVKGWVHLKRTYDDLPWINTLNISDASNVIE